MQYDSEEHDIDEGKTTAPESSISSDIVEEEDSCRSYAYFPFQPP